MARSVKTSSVPEDEHINYSSPSESLSSEEYLNNSDLLADRIAAQGPHEEETPSRPKTPPKVTDTLQNATPFIFKAHSSDLINVALEKPKKMTKAEIEVVLCRELRGAIFEDVEDLVDNVFHRQNIPWDDIWKEELLRTVRRKGGKGDKEVIEDKSYNNVTRTWTDWPPTNTQRTEIELGEHFNAVAEIIREKLGLAASDDDLIFSPRYALCGKGTETETTHVRKPDLIALPRCLEHVEEVSWESFKAFVSLKISTGTVHDERMQLVEYARLTFSAQPNRRYVPCVGFRHTKLTLYVFDRAGVLASRVYDVNEEPEQFLRIAIGILFLDHQALGYDASFFAEGNKRFVKLGRSTYKISKDLFLDRTIRGRGTVCLKVRGTGRESSEVYVVKDAWIDRSRAKKEVEILNILRERKVQNVPKVILDGIVQVEDLKTGEFVNDTTDIFRGHEVFDVEIRDHYRIVMQPYGVPITRFSSLLELMHAMLDILQTIIDLDEIGIIHRDISLGNLVLVPVPNSKFRKGFIIDFDHAIEKNRKGKGIAEAERTGTLPYIAIDILQRYAEHAADHDAESLLYVLIWITFAQAGANGMDRKLPPEEWDKTILRAWSPPGDLTPSSLDVLSDAKKVMMVDTSKFAVRILNNMHSFFHPLKLCLLQLRKALFPPPPKLDTLEDLAFIVAGGLVTAPIRRDKDAVLRGMKEAFKCSIKDLEKLRSAEVPSEPTTNQGEMGSDTSTQGDVGDAPKVGGRPQYVVNHMPTHQMKLRNRLTDEKKSADTTPRAPDAEKEGSLRIHVLRNSYMEGQASLKRSRATEDDATGEAGFMGSSNKKLKTSTGLQLSNRATGSTNSVEKNNKASTTKRMTRSMSSTEKNLG